eukprot:10383650-Alexandrium_andersonii.AAC.1
MVTVARPCASRSRFSSKDVRVARLTGAPNAYAWQNLITAQHLHNPVYKELLHKPCALSSPFSRRECVVRLAS